MNAPELLTAMDSYAGLLPYPGAPDIEVRLERLEQNLRADDASLFAPAKIALQALNGEPATKAHVLCLSLIARWHYYDVDFEAAAVCSAAAVALARTLGEPCVRAKALKIMGIALFEGGKLAEAIPVVLEGLENARLARDDVQVSETLTNLGITLQYAARHSLAQECYEQATAISPRSSQVWTNKAYLFLEVGEIACGLEAAQRGLSLMPNVKSVEWRINRIHLEVLLARLRVAIGDIQEAREHANTALAEASHTTEFGRRLARLAFLLVDAHDRSTSDKAIECLLGEVRQNRPSFSLYRTSLQVAVAALRAAGRPEQALGFLREIAELDTMQRARVASQTLPPDLSEQSLELDHLADARTREQLSSLLAQAARKHAAMDQQLQDLVGMAIRAELREEDTFSNGEHVFRVARLAECLAQEVGCTNEEIHVARLAGLLHDVGKTFAPDQVLLKRRTLTDKEKALLRRHSEDGAVLIENLKYETLLPVAEAVRHSHERWDGVGYPEGLQGEDIPMPARIIAICDSFDAMTHWRPFRSPRSFASAMSEIEAGAGSRYDPRLSRLFVTLLRRLHREAEDLDRFLAEGAEISPVVQEQRRLARLLRPQRETL